MLTMVVLLANSGVGSDAPAFAPPVRLLAGDHPIAVESPGFACPSWFDVDGDGKKDLVVGQFAGGKIAIYRNLGGLKFAERQWLEADGKVATVPGIS